MKKLESKKFTVVITLLVLTTGLAVFGLLTQEVAGVFTLVGSVYLGGQSYVDGKKDE